MLDPRICNIFADANAVDKPAGDVDRARDVDRLLQLWGGENIRVLLPRGVLVEIQNPKTPQAVRDATMGAIFTLSVGLTADEQRTRATIRAELQGNALSAKHAADADHLAEAAKYGGGYFITHDERVLKRSGRLRDVLGPTLQVVTLAEFLTIYDGFAGNTLSGFSAAPDRG
jgi:hypothetical protein